MDMKKWSARMRQKGSSILLGTLNIGGLWVNKLDSNGCSWLLKTS